jgi:hypothetical protein
VLIFSKYIIQLNLPVHDIAFAIHYRKINTVLYCIIVAAYHIYQFASIISNERQRTQQRRNGGGGGRKEGRKETSVELRWRLIVVTQSLTPVFPASRRGRTASSARFRERVNRVIAVHVRD